MKEFARSEDTADAQAETDNPPDNTGHESDEDRMVRVGINLDEETVDRMEIPNEEELPVDEAVEALGLVVERTFDTLREEHDEFETELGEVELAWSPDEDPALPSLREAVKSNAQMINAMQDDLTGGEGAVLAEPVVERLDRLEEEVASLRQQRSSGGDV